MLQGIILIIHSLAASSMRDNLLDLVIWRNISEPVLVVKLPFQLLLDPAAMKRRISVAPEFKLQKARKSLGGAVEQFIVDMKEARYLSVLKVAVTSHL